MAIKIWNGSSWTNSCHVRVWNGSSWIDASTARTWNGSSWVTFFPPLVDVSASNFKLETSVTTSSSRGLEAPEAVAQSTFEIRTDGTSKYISVGGNAPPFSHILEVNGVIVNTLPSTAELTNILETWVVDECNIFDSDTIAVRVAHTGNTLTASSNALNTFLTLNQNRSWSLLDTNFTFNSTLTKTANLTVTFAQASNTNNILDTALIELKINATRGPSA